MPCHRVRIRRHAAATDASLPKTALPARGRIGCGVALASAGGSRRWKDNPHHWQTHILLVLLLHNPDEHG